MSESQSKEPPQPPTLQTATPAALPANNPGSSSSNLQLLAKVSHSFSGPLPPPSMLEKYEQISPGLSRCIFSLAEGESLHRHFMEKGLLEVEQKNATAECALALRGQIFAFVLALALIGFGAGFLYLEKELPGWLFSTTGIGGLVVAFLTKRGQTSQAPRELPEKIEQPPRRDKNKRRRK